MYMYVLLRDRCENEQSYAMGVRSMRPMQSSWYDERRHTNYLVWSDKPWRANLCSPGTMSPPTPSLLSISARCGQNGQKWETHVPKSMVILQLLQHSDTTSYESSSGQWHATCDFSSKYNETHNIKSFEIWFWKYLNGVSDFILNSWGMAVLFFWFEHLLATSQLSEPRKPRKPANGWAHACHTFWNIHTHVTHSETQIQPKRTLLPWRGCSCSGPTGPGATSTRTTHRCRYREPSTFWILLSDPLSDSVFLYNNWGYSIL